ncbi:M20/M25/M40 family metallo-hydrolase [Pedobacter gandavensis]|uniref:M20/M25/M40 family metallo-hydrolase n=1 Tax=Pedobacter gandavensis TaxID=2679963 RepID=UPI00292CAEB4|nr:M20/M25/M40 family metallo-hydrolase [Pedobacter gandavensis]
MNSQSLDQSGREPDFNTLSEASIGLLKKLIASPSFSGEENDTAELIESFLHQNGVFTFRKRNNIWCYNKYFDPSKPTLLLNSHHDTVRPTKSYQFNPFLPFIQEGKLYGLGSNDAGGGLVALIATFLHFYTFENLPYNLCLAATAEEETSGEYGLKSVLPELQNIAFAIIAEPTQMEMAVAEKGSMVLDCTSFGKAGHAAREEGDNAIYKALLDIQWFSEFLFPIEGDLLNPVKMTVTEVHAGLQHNIVPAECDFTVDIRFTHGWTWREILTTVQNHTTCQIKVRPNVMKPSFIDGYHPLVMAGKEIGKTTYCSPTSSDQGWLEVPSLKMGPGDSARSHMADEYIYVEEIRTGIEDYICMLEKLFGQHGKQKALVMLDNYYNC